MSRRRDNPVAGRDVGMEVSTSHADSVVDGWRYLATAALEAYLRAHEAPFLTQNLIIWARANALPDAPNEKAWGTVVRGAARQHIIEIDSYTKEGTYNANMKPLWKATKAFRERLQKETRLRRWNSEEHQDRVEAGLEMSAGPEQRKLF